MKKILLSLLLASSVFAEQRDYSAITDRNAFTLLDREPAKVELPKILEKPPVKLNLTGIMTYKGETNVYLFSKDIPKRFLTLNSKRRTDSGITLLSVSQGLAEVDNNGVVELLSFDTHRLPSTITVSPLSKPTVIKKDKKESSKKEGSKSARVLPTPPQPSVIKVPSRNRGITDPRMQSIMEKGLEYLNKMDDEEKREQIMKRLESLQSGQYKLKSNIDQNERRRQYDEWRKSRERKK
tara:strand:- start:200 stop:913 length:714 start_codon:yes stop_codon:yes gene_type:complete